ncbi:hypothetical protein LCGC14_1806760, partial [marine sediment metagenome]
YNINDRVGVTGWLGDSPVLEFLSRGGHTSSITGEKLTEHQVVQAMARAARAGGLRIHTFVLRGHFASLPYYELRVEQADGLDADRLARELDGQLRGMNVEYDGKRNGRLGTIRATCLPAGTFARDEAEHVAHHGARTEQYKHKYLVCEVVNDDSL